MLKSKRIKFSIFFFENILVIDFFNNFELQSTFMIDKDIINEIGRIRFLMEKSSKFMSISGISGVMIGIYALIGASVAYYLGINSSIFDHKYINIPNDILLKYILVAALVLFLSIGTGVYMASYKAKKVNQSIWNPTSKALLQGMLIPLITGGIFCLILVSKELYEFLAAVMLVFYGLSLCSASNFSFKELRWLGILDIILGLLALCLPVYGLYFWALGFGILHIIYGLIVYQRYEK